MIVYVDPPFRTIPTRRWRWGKASHLWADTPEELHAFAAQIGLSRHWFQAHKYLPHYDLTMARRQVAVRRGAVEQSLRDLVLFMRKQKWALEETLERS